MTAIRLGVVSTHPIQYYAPLFRALAARAELELRVFYTWSQAAAGPVFDREFGRDIEWDVPLRDGYDHVFVPNTAGRPRLGRYFGVRNPGLIAQIEAWRADALLVFSWNLSSHLGAMRHFKGRIPVLFRGDSTLLDPLPPWRRLARRAVLYWVYRHIDVALAVGRNSAAYFRWCGLPATRVVIAPHAVDNDRFNDPGGGADDSAARRREALGIPADAIVFLFAAKFIAKKDPMLLLEAFLDAGVAAHLVLVGDGVLEPALRRAAHGRADVHFLPAQNQRAMPAVYRLGDVYVLPSRGPGETWGLALNEAMASGRCVIAGSRAGGARDLIVEGETGWTFESGDRAALGAALIDAAGGGRERLLGMGRAARWAIAASAIDVTAARIAHTVLRLAGVAQA